MPHTSSRRRIPVAHRTKLTTSASSDGWSHIVRKGSSSTANPSTKFLPPTTSSGSSGYSNAELVELLTPAQLTHYCRLRSHEEKRHKANDMQVSEFTDERLGPQPQAPRYSEQELWKQFERVTGEWRSCGMEVRLRNVVESARVLELEEDVEEDNGRAGSDRHDVEHNQGAEGLANTLDQLSLRDKPAMISHKVICLGLGSPSADASGWRHIVLWQLVAFLAIADILQSPLSNDTMPITKRVLKLYAQDPVFNKLDISFLSSLNIEVVTTPSAFTLIDIKAIVYAPHYPVACWSSEMRQGQAKCIIGNDVVAALASGRILGQKELLDVFARHGADGGEGEEEVVPDLHAKEELEEFEKEHDSLKWPEPTVGVAEGTFNDMVIYWPRRTI